MSNVLNRIVAEMTNQPVLVEYKGDYMILPHLNSLPRTLVLRFANNHSTELEWSRDLLFATELKEAKNVWKDSPVNIEKFVKQWFKASGYEIDKVRELAWMIEAASDGLEYDLRKLKIDGLIGFVFTELPLSRMLDIANILISNMETMTFQRLSKFDNLGWNWTANVVADLFDQKEAEFQGNSTDKNGNNPKYQADFHPRQSIPPKKKIVDFDSPENAHVKDVLLFLTDPSKSQKTYKFANGQKQEIISKKD